MLSVLWLNDTILNVVRLNVVKMSVMVPLKEFLSWMNIFQLTNFYDELVVEVKKNMKKREKKSISYFKKWNSAFLTFFNNNVDKF